MKAPNALLLFMLPASTVIAGASCDTDAGEVEVQPGWEWSTDRVLETVNPTERAWRRNTSNGWRAYRGPEKLAHFALYRIVAHHEFSEVVYHK